MTKVVRYSCKIGTIFSHISPNLLRIFVRLLNNVNYLFVPWLAGITWFDDSSEFAIDIVVILKCLRFSGHYFSQSLKTLFKLTLLRSNDALFAVINEIPPCYYHVMQFTTDVLFVLFCDQLSAN